MKTMEHNKLRNKQKPHLATPLIRNKNKTKSNVAIYRLHKYTIFVKQYVDMNYAIYMLCFDG